MIKRNKRLKRRWLRRRRVAQARMKEHHADHGFINPSSEFEHGRLRDVLRWVFLERRRAMRVKRRSGYYLELGGNDGTFIRYNHAEFAASWIGHSTVLIQIEGVNILTDPVWSQHISPLGFAGPRRFVPPGIAFGDLPDIHVVLITHNHYDHFDKTTIKRLGNRPLYFVPLGMGKYLRRYGITHYREFDWWESRVHRGIEFVCAPAQHYSARGIFDRDKTLWGSWIGLGRNDRFYFSGDTGYFDGFREIGERYGPFDLVCLPIGAYLPRWFMEPIHMGPEDAIRAYHDLRGRVFLAMHWGTFNLAMEPPDLPPQVLMEEIDRLQLDKSFFWPFRHGETRVIHGTEYEGTDETGKEADNETERGIKEFR